MKIYKGVPKGTVEKVQVWTKADEVELASLLKRKDAVTNNNFAKLVDAVEKCDLSGIHEYKLYTSELAAFLQKNVTILVPAMQAFIE